MPPAKRTSKPVILISARHIDSHGRDRPELTRLYAAYYDAVTAAGGLPLIAPPLREPDDVARLLDVADGVLLTGGYDLRPDTYGQPRHPKTRLMTRRRETFELTLARAALGVAPVASNGCHTTPILAICLGIQVLNVAAGGTLHQHVPDVVGRLPAPRGSGRTPKQASPARRHRAGHRADAHRQTCAPDAHVVVLDRGSLAARVMGTTRLSVNSTHHQAVDRVGTGLRVSGRCEADGLVEAIEGAGRRFVLGVQWHPERLTDRPAHLALFGGLVAAARGKGT